MRLSLSGPTPRRIVATGWLPLQWLRIPTAWGYTGQQDLTVSFHDPFRST